MDPFLAGKLALVTGGGRGIGAAIARALAAAGARVVVCGRTKPELDTVAREIGGVAMRLDLTDRPQTDEVIASVGPVDVLINNAGVAESAPSMVARKWGRVINIASNAGVSGYGYSTAYCAAKHAMVGMTRALAIDLARTGVTINALCPGWVETQMAEEAVTRIAAKTGRSEDEARTQLAAMSPQRRMITPDEVAHAALMLCGDGARGIHGQALVIDGGAVLK